MYFYVGVFVVARASEQPRVDTKAARFSGGLRFEIQRVDFDRERFAMQVGQPNVSTVRYGFADLF